MALALTKAVIGLTALGAAAALGLTITVQNRAAEDVATVTRRQAHQAGQALDRELALVARERIDAAMALSATPMVRSALDERNKDLAAARSELPTWGQQTLKQQSLAFLWITDETGSVVVHAADPGLGMLLASERVASYPLVKDALAGYRRDDTWVRGDKVLFAAASPVVAGAADKFVGTVIAGVVLTPAIVSRLSTASGSDVSCLADLRSAGAKADEPGRGAFVGGSQPFADVPAETLVQLPVGQIAKPGTTAAGAAGAAVGPGGKPGSHLLAAAEIAGGRTPRYGVGVPLRGEAALSNARCIASIKTPAMTGMAGIHVPMWGLVLAFVLPLALGFFAIALELDRPLAALIRMLSLPGRPAKLEVNEYGSTLGPMVRVLGPLLTRLSEPTGHVQGQGQPHREQPRTTMQGQGNGQGNAAQGQNQNPGAGNAAAGGGAPSVGLELSLAGPAPSKGLGHAEKVEKSDKPAKPPKPGKGAGLSPPPQRLPTEKPPAAKDKSGANLPLNRSADIMLDDKLSDLPLDPPPPKRESAKKESEKAATSLARGPSASDNDPITSPGGDDIANEEAYFREVYQQFLDTKASCGESTDVPFDKFSRKLRKNRDELVNRLGCPRVRFQVYVKDGKAALKALPMHEENQA